jgi:1,2-phenylacetyl-CoA epoxidase catalytic subunit
MYMEMAQEEMRHANNLYNIGQEFMDELSWVSDDDKMKWGRLGARMADKLALAKMMLTA